MKLLSAEYKEEEYFGHMLLTIWMRVLNLPTILRKSLVDGTMFGVTQKVDTPTTWANKFGCFVVGVLDPYVIPTRVDVIIGNRFFELEFEVEPFEPTLIVRMAALEYHQRRYGGDDDNVGNG